MKAQITDPRHSKTPVQENTPRKDAAFPRNNNNPLTFLYGIWDCLPFPSRRRQSWPWTVFAACWRPEMLSTLQNLAPEMLNCSWIQSKLAFSPEYTENYSLGFLQGRKRQGALARMQAHKYSLTYCLKNIPLLHKELSSTQVLLL